MKARHEYADPSRRTPRHVSQQARTVYVSGTRRPGSVQPMKPGRNSLLLLVPGGGRWWGTRTPNGTAPRAGHGHDGSNDITRATVHDPASSPCW